ncbi:MAG: hypothetical protein M0R48_07770 [Candidatus Omnitrophica bacterium]|jgi:hypothetical protein|nr:hypothetical protein [Candidatus Omnitrophota bacterium]
MKIRVRIFLAICTAVFLPSLFFTIAGYKAQEKALLGGVGQNYLAQKSVVVSKANMLYYSIRAFI